MSNISAAGLGWPSYFQPLSNNRQTAKVRRFNPPHQASDEPSRAAREPALFALHEQLDRIALLPDNWDGHGSARPDPLAVEHARQFLEDTYHQSVVALGQQTQERIAASWQSPHISASEEGEIVFEWWNGTRKLTIYVGPQQLTYIKSWGAHVVNDMEDGVLPGDGIPLLWTWLFA